jgi:hypothetical protein
MHTIGWLVYDNAGRGDGIGSRFFTVLNSGLTSAGPEEPLPVATLHYGKTDSYSLAVEPLGRVELETGATKGYLVANGERMPLPAGSSLTGGVFHWQLGAGFRGHYSLEFERADDSMVHASVRVR